MLEGRESAKERSLVTCIRTEGIEESIMERATNNNQNNQNRYPVIGTRTQKDKRSRLMYNKDKRNKRIDKSRQGHKYDIIRKERYCITTIYTNKKDIRVSAPLLSTFYLPKAKEQHQGLNFAEQTGSGAVTVVWSFLKQ